jgi:hypothetical protein
MNKELTKYLIYGFLIFYILAISYISGIIYYLNTLKDCSCYKEENKTNYSNITYLIVIESFILTMFIIGLIGSIFIIYYMNNVKNIPIMTGGKQSSLYTFLIILLLFSLIGCGIQIYFIYNVYKLSENVNNECICTKSWLRYLLYIQTIIITFGLLMSVFYTIPNNLKKTRNLY